MQVTVGKAHVQEIKWILAGCHLDASVYVSWCCACWLIIALARLSETLEWNAAIVKFRSNTLLFLWWQVKMSAIKKTHCLLTAVQNSLLLTTAWHECNVSNLESRNFLSNQCSSQTCVQKTHIFSCLTPRRITVISRSVIVAFRLSSVSHAITLFIAWTDCFHLVQITLLQRLETINNNGQTWPESKSLSKTNIMLIIHPPTCCCTETWANNFSFFASKSSKLL